MAGSVYYGGLKNWMYRAGALLKSRKARDIAQTRDVKDLIMGRFEKWLDEVLTEETPIEGIDRQLYSELERSETPDPEASSGDRQDHYATWSAITALTQEVRLQGRTFKELSNQVEALSHSGFPLNELARFQEQTISQVSGLTESLQSTLNTCQRDLKSEAEARARNTFLDALLDIRDRLTIGLKSTRETQETLDALAQAKGIKRWFRGEAPGRRQAAAIAAALRKGYILGIERIEEILQQYGIREIPCAGELFDPAIMSAVDVEETTDVPDGMVLDVYRPGYATDSETIRTAQVRVARGPQHLPTEREATK